MFRCAEAAGLSLCEHLSPQYGRCRTLPIMLCCKTCRGMDRNEDKTTSDLHQPVCVTVCWWRLSHRKSTVAPAGYMKVFGFQRTEKCPLINTSWRNMLDHFTAAWTRDWVQSGLNSTCTAHQGASTHRKPTASRTSWTRLFGPGPIMTSVRTKIFVFRCFQDQMNETLRLSHLSLCLLSAGVSLHREVFLSLWRGQRSEGEKIHLFICDRLHHLFYWSVFLFLSNGNVFLVLPQVGNESKKIYFSYKQQL